MSIFIIPLIFGVCVALAASEAKAWLPYLSARLVRLTLAKMPDGLNQAMRQRWSEEIESDLDRFRDRPLGGLLFALRLYRKGSRTLAAELMLGQALSASSAGAIDSSSDLRIERMAVMDGSNGMQVVFIGYNDGSFVSREIDREGNATERRVNGDDPAFLRYQARKYLESLDPNGKKKK